MIIRRFDVLSVAKVAGILYAGMGFIAGLIFACISLVAGGIISAAAAKSGDTLPPFFGMIFGVGAVIALPIMYGIMGFLVGALTAWLYNLCAGMVGGIRVEVEQ